MTLSRYQQLAARTISTSLNKTQIRLHSLHGLCSEVGELNGIYQKAFQGHGVESEHLKKECGDILWMLAEFCTSCGFDLEEIAQKNIDKLRARYPDGFDKEKSLHRAEGDI